MAISVQLLSLIHILCITPDELHKSDFVPPIVFSHLDIYLNNTSRRQDIYNHREVQYLQACLLYTSDVYKRHLQYNAS